MAKTNLFLSLKNKEDFDNFCNFYNNQCCSSTMSKEEVENFPLAQEYFVALDALCYLDDQKDGDLKDTPEVKIVLDRIEAQLAYFETVAWKEYKDEIAYVLLSYQKGSHDETSLENDALQLRKYLVWLDDWSDGEILDKICVTEEDKNLRNLVYLDSFTYGNVGKFITLKQIVELHLVDGLDKADLKSWIEYSTEILED